MIYNMDIMVDEFPGGRDAEGYWPDEGVKFSQDATIWLDADDGIDFIILHIHGGKAYGIQVDDLYRVLKIIKMEARMRELPQP